MSGLLVAQIPPGQYVVPTEPPAELAHASYFEEFDGLMVLDNTPGARYVAGPVQSPGGGGTPVASQAYTTGAIPGITGKLGGQPLPVANPIWRTGRGYTQGGDQVQGFQLTHRGVGQNYQGMAQTVQLSQITGAPPVPGDITSIIAGYG